MLKQDKNNSLTPPSLIEALTGGFDAVANHIMLLLFPLVFDLFLWLGPRVRLSELIQHFMDEFQAIASQGSTNTPADMAEMMRLTIQVWGVIAERANLLTAFRTYPVGIPSLMAARLPIESPLGKPIGFEVGIVQFLGFWLLFTILGLFCGTFYFDLTAQIALNRHLEWIEELKNWPRAFMQVIWLTLFLAIFLLILCIPVMLFFSMILFLTGELGQWIVLLLSGALLWFLMPLLFSGHGIFTDNMNMFPSLLQGIRFFQFTIPKTSLFILIGFVLSQGLNLIWEIPPENSWLSLLGILGHAFVFTGLLSSSFVYYKRSGTWLVEMINQRKSMLNQSGGSGNKA